MSTEQVGQPGLKRAISRKLLLLLIIGAVLGAGIYALIGEVASEVGGAIWVPFCAALALALLTAASYAELVSKYPRAGGAALYSKKAFRSPFIAFIVAFCVMASGVTSASTLARVCFTTALALILMATGDLATLADTTVLLLLGVFLIVNISVLVLRRQPVSHPHLTTPIALPALGAAGCVALFTQTGTEVFARAGALLLPGGSVWLLDRGWVRWRRG